MNICLCGSQAGYPHKAHCPFPYFGRSEKEQERWLSGYRSNHSIEFLKAFNAWLESPELCGGPLFDQMLDAYECIPAARSNGCVPS